MRVNIYQTRYDTDRTISLVREKSQNYPEINVIDSPESCVKIMETLFDVSNLTEERVWLIALNGARKISGLFEISRGTLTSSLIHPREIFLRAILAGAASIIIIHNHPSGLLLASTQDIEVTKRIHSVGDLIGIPLDDHIIVANGGYVSVM